MTRTRIVTPREVDRRLLAACTRRLAPAALQPGETLVERTGVMGVSLTFRGRPGGWVRGCDATVGLHGPGGRWCGVAIGRVRPGGRLYDPRLDIGCLNAKGRQIGFAWIDPLPEARYVAVDGHHYTEVYERAAGLPVRLTTDDVRVEGSSAAFRLTQYAADGSRLAQETVRTTVAG